MNKQKRDLKHNSIKVPVIIVVKIYLYYEFLHKIVKTYIVSLYKIKFEILMVKAKRFDLGET